MHEDEPGRSARDPVDEAMAGSFPASDPPAWTATRSGEPRRPEEKRVRSRASTAVPQHCEAVGLFASAAAAQSAADRLLESGFNMVDIGPPRVRGNLGAGIGARPAGTLASIGPYAVLGALASGAIAALFGERGARPKGNMIAAAVGGAAGAISAHLASGWVKRRDDERDWPARCALLRVRLKTPEDHQRATTILERSGAWQMHVSWPPAD